MTSKRIGKYACLEVAFGDYNEWTTLVNNLV
jgi:hypothetical protein